MFRAKLIEHKSFYKLRHKLLIFSLIGAITIGIASNIIIPKYLNTATYIVGLIAVFVIAIVFFRKQYKIQKGIDGLIKNKKIEISEQSIRIVKADKTTEKEFIINNQSFIKVKDSYEIPEEHLKNIVNEISGKSIENYVIYKNNNSEVRFDFIIDSYYMIEKLKKVIVNWKAVGISVESIN